MGAGQEASRAECPDLQVTIEDLFSTGDAVAVYSAWQGAQKGTLPQ